ncbi:MAG: carboxypeptidase-like regulatory domain-containing protein [Gemmatimonadota bacterium]|nr:carboxypeptidase-like regulatory domain-containing protein [Gemmatimonadota bacterium]MDE2985958.1 carboxypeptidase-like regulatory domain-containing protein [Gemmatimonadota bacterium]
MGGRTARWMSVRVFAACLWVIVGELATLQAQEPTRDTESLRVTLHVRDADTNEPLLGALVELAGRSRRYVTGVGGHVSFEIPPGRYTFTAHKGGYATLRGDFRVVYQGNLTVMMHDLGDVDASIPGRLLVRVAEFGSGRLIEGAAVSLSGGQARLTDGQGWVEFGDVGGPVAEVTVRTFGYETRTEPISLHEGRTTVVEVAMAIDAVVLAPLEVEVESGFLERQGVYWRIDRGWPDKLLTREELIEQAVPRLADAFRSVSGVRVDYWGPFALLKTHTGCPIPVFFDGRQLGAEAGLNYVVGLNIDDIPAEEVELAEFYEPGRVPARFVLPSTDNCGAVLLWSRERAGKG